MYSLLNEKMPKTEMWRAQHPHFAQVCANNLALAKFQTQTRKQHTYNAAYHVSACKNASR